MLTIRRSLIFLLLVVFSSVFIFAGCREKTPPEKKQTYDGIELTYYKMFDDSDLIEPLLKDYEASHPGLKVRYRKFANFDEYQKVILNEMAEGEGPDIFSMQNTWFFSNYKKLAPMPDSFGVPADFAETFVDVAYKDLVRTDEEGNERVYGMPMTVDNLALYYNKDHFEDRIPSRGRPADTWEGIKEDVVLLNKEDSSFDRFDVSGIAMGRADNVSRAVDTLYLLFLQYGVELYDDILSKAVFAGKEGVSNNYPGLKALEFLVSFSNSEEKNYSWNEYVVEDDAESQEIRAFAEGKVSMIVGYAYTYDLILNEIALLNSKGSDSISKSAIKVAPIPQLYDPKKSQDKRVTYASYFAEGVSRNSEHQDLAWDLLIHMASKESQEFYFKEAKKPTSRRDLIDAQKKDPIYGVFVAQVGFAESFPIIDYYLYKDVFENVINRANLEGAVKDTLIDAQDAISELLPAKGLVVPKKSKE